MFAMRSNEHWYVNHMCQSIIENKFYRHSLILSEIKAKREIEIKLQTTWSWHSWAWLPLQYCIFSHTVVVVMLEVPTSNPG
jgi:hypothetical protein